MGSGKTLTATTLSVLDFIQTGRRVIANYRIDLERINDEEFIREVIMPKFEVYAGEQLMGIVDACHDVSARTKIHKAYPDMPIEILSAKMLDSENGDAAKNSFMYLDYETFVRDMKDNVEFYGCFPAGTKILACNRNYSVRKIDGTRDGHGSIISKSIEDLSVGDMVLSYNVTTGVKEFKKIVKRHVRKSTEMMSIYFSNNNWIRCTPEHPIAVVKDNGIVWMKARDLRDSDLVIQHECSGRISVVGISENAVSSEDVHNLEVEKNNNYFANDILVHNCTFVIDEAYLWADSRLSQTPYSRLLSYFVLQSRKRDVDLYLTSQQFENVDIRLRRNAEVRGLSRFNKKTQICTLRLIDLRTGQRRRVRIFGPEIYKFYDTREIPPLQAMHTRM